MKFALITAAMLAPIMALAPAAPRSTEVFSFDISGLKQIPVKNGTHQQLSEATLELPEPRGDLQLILVEVSQVTDSTRNHYNFSEIWGDILSYNVGNVLSVSETDFRHVTRLPDLEVNLGPGQLFESEVESFNQTGRVVLTEYQPEVSIRNLSNFEHASRDLIFISKFDFESDLKVDVTYFY